MVTTEEMFFPPGTCDDYHTTELKDGVVVKRSRCPLPRVVNGSMVCDFHPSDGTEELCMHVEDIVKGVQASGVSYPIGLWLEPFNWCCNVLVMKPDSERSAFNLYKDVEAWRKDYYVVSQLHARTYPNLAPDYSEESYRETRYLSLWFNPLFWPRHVCDLYATN